MRPLSTQKGFTLVEVMIATLLFAFVLIAITQIFSDVLALQRRATGYQSLQDTAVLISESISKDVRASIVSTTAGCGTTLSMTHPTYGTVGYSYDASAKALSRTVGGVTSVITPSDVVVSKFQFCVLNSGVDNAPTRVTVPMTLQSKTGIGASAATLPLQVTIVSRDITQELSN